MGYYEGQRDRPCPRCGGVVATLFISVSPMSFSQRCRGCGATEFTPDEEARLADNVLPENLMPSMPCPPVIDGKGIVVDRPTMPDRWIGRRP